MRLNGGRPQAGLYTTELAAMLIYLNRTGFNGLFRVNADARRAGIGAYRVPARRAINSNAARRGLSRST